MARTKVFISYSHADRRFLDRLRVFLKPLERDGRIEWWDDTRIKTGLKWREEIKTAVESARVAVLLISADFFASDFIHKNELPPLLEAAARDEAVLLSVILQPVDLSGSPLGEFQAINDPARPLGKLRSRAERDEVWVQVTKAIEAALDTTGPSVQSPSVPTLAPEPPAKPIPKRRQKKKPLKVAPYTAPPSGEEAAVSSIKPEAFARAPVPAVSRPDPLKTSPRWQGSFVQVAWWRATELWDEFKSCRLGLLSIAIGSFFFLGRGQGVEVLRVVGEGNAGGQWYWPRVLGFFAALGLWAVCNWYTARALFYFDFPGVRRRLPSTASWDAIIDALQSLLPRLLGVAPFLIVGLGFFHAATPYAPGAAARFWLHLFASICVVLAIAFYGLLVLRRRWVGKMPARELQTLRELDRGRILELVTIGGATCLVSLLLLTLFTINPVSTPQLLGPALIVCFAMSSWVTLGGVLVFVSSRYQVPVISLVLSLALIFSRWNDNHVIRTVPAQEVSRLDVIQSFRNWYDLAEKNDGPGVLHPLYVVATEGGGIRAAYWTAIVLGGLQDANPSFASHLFAISGVSGASLGAVVFNALLAEPSGDGKLKDKADAILSQDFLSPALASMLYPDFIQRFLPFPVEYFDRGRALELGWEKGWRDTMMNDRLAGPFVDLWKSGSREWMPALFLNGTSVEKGHRIITTNLRLTNVFLDAEDAADTLASGSLPATKAACNIPLSTAVNMSSRASPMSPAGRFPNGSHIVEGGCFEPSGATTALEIVTRINDFCQYSNITNVRVKVIMISNDPRKSSLAIAPAKPGPAPPGPVRTEALTIQGQWLNDLTATLYAVLNARDARGVYAQKAIRREQRPFKADEPEHLPSDTADIVYFGLLDMEGPLPLGWMLSRAAAETMSSQLGMNAGVIKNGEAMDEVLKALPPNSK